MLKRIISMMMSVVFIFGVAVIPVNAAEPVTWDSKISIGNPVLKDNNLTAQVGSDDIVSASRGVREGKWYWEITIQSKKGNGSYLGIISADINQTDVWHTNLCIGYRQDGVLQTSITPTGGEIRTWPSDSGDIIGIALDMDNKSIQYYKNGQQMGGMIDFTSFYNGKAIYPGIKWTVQLAGSNSVTTANFGATPFQYDIPDGYEPYDQSGSWYQREALLSVLLAVDEEIQLSLSNNLAENSNYTWSSDDTSIATVDAAGKITATGEGITRIYARNDAGYEEFINVRVLEQVEEIRLAVDLQVGSSARMYLSDAENIVWTSLSPNVVEVDSNGTVTAISSGLALIQAELEGQTYNIYVRVRN